MGRTNRLLIVVPYRDRAVHLAEFVPHVRAYFARDKLDRAIDYRVLVVEQTPGLPFNGGALKNAGFLIGASESDYTCFHDVDYLPIWADYSWVDVPTPLVWHGAEVRPVAPGQSNCYVRHDLRRFFGAAVIVPNEALRTANGYSNLYWGWGYEDEDLKARFLAAGIALGRRKGTYRALDHVNAGYLATGKPSAIAEANRAFFEARQAAGIATASDGLSTAAFDIVERKRLADPQPERDAAWEIVTVSLHGRPSAAQARALAFDSASVGVA